MNRAIIVVLLVFCVCSFFNDQAWSRSTSIKKRFLGEPRERPGICPKFTGIGIVCVTSHIECIWDSDCQDLEKCCPIDCGRVCKHAVFGKRELKPRSGSCPKPTGPGLCAELCGSGCPKGQKCCSNGCGHQCMNTV